MELISFKPIYKKRIWGGQMLAKRLGRPIPKDQPIGESWDISDREDDQSIVANGIHKGESLKNLLSSFGDQIMGPKFSKKTPFPILVKWLDCKETLSLQVHPPDRICKELGAQPKTENWYILDSQQDASLYIGLNSGITIEKFRENINSPNLKSFLKIHKSRPGNSYFIESGTLHAIGGGNLILEIQQNSDTTFRVHDWNRVGLDGKPRKLHVEKSVKSLTNNNLKAKFCCPDPSSSILADCPHFRIRLLKISKKTPSIKLLRNITPSIISVVEGNINDVISNLTLKLGDSALLPYAADAELTTDTQAKILITDRF